MASFCEEEMELPPGFRFHPTDEELISHYLIPKIDNTCFSAVAIGEVDLNKVEPWELPWKAKMGENEWYFFCVRDRKYPTGLRTNRATESGYWKATGKDKEIYKAKTLVGMKKTLVFYKGRAPKGEKSNWVMHEYRLEGKYSINSLPKTANNEWVISRIFHKTSGGRKIHISRLVNVSDYIHESKPSNLPPLLDLSNTTKASTSNVPCFSKQVEEAKEQKLHDPFNSTCVLLPSPKQPFQNSLFSSQTTLQYPESLWLQDQSIIRFLMEYNGEEAELKNNSNTEFSQDAGGLNTDMSSAVSNYEMGGRFNGDQEYPITSVGP